MIQIGASFDDCQKMGGNEWKTFKNTELNPRIWKILTACFALLSFVFLIALIVVALRDSTNSKGDTSGNQDKLNGIKTCAQGLESSDKTPKSQGVFDDLSSDEISAVRDYMLSCTSQSQHHTLRQGVHQQQLYLLDSTTDSL